MKSILITGGTGSFGQAFAKYLLRNTSANRIVIYSRGEHLQESMEKEFRTIIDSHKLRMFIGDVRDKDRLEFAMRGIDTVVHAAALKIVPAAEYNPTECVATNIYGAENVVKAAIRCGVKKVVALSTDKAVNPINLYGATKLAMEKIFIAANALGAGNTTFSVVRYGNVAGSRGSVIPFFLKKRADKEKLPITHEKMTRFCITMDQAIELVMMAIRSGIGECIYIPKIPSMGILDLAGQIDPGGEIEIIGIRPGEKIHECLMTEDESGNAFEWHDHFAILPHGWKDINLGAAKSVRTGFRYTSDMNTRWLTWEEMETMIQCVAKENNLPR
jgi:UDP-N-acetylglucosamine 4,6-dehydratase/5-epimerase